MEKHDRVSEGQEWRGGEMGISSSAALSLESSERRAGRMRAPMRRAAEEGDGGCEYDVDASDSWCWPSLLSCAVDPRRTENLSSSRRCRSACEWGRGSEERGRRCGD